MSCIIISSYCILHVNLHVQEFLADYGLVWVGNSESLKTDGQDIMIGQATDDVWSQSDSLPQQFEIDFNLFVTKVKELNVLCGEGVFKIEHTADGARLKVSLNYCIADGARLKVSLNYCIADGARLKDRFTRLYY